MWFHLFRQGKCFDCLDSLLKLTQRCSRLDKCFFSSIFPGIFSHIMFYNARSVHYLVQTKIYLLLFLLLDNSEWNLVKTFIVPIWLLAITCDRWSYHFSSLHHCQISIIIGRILGYISKYLTTKVWKNCWEIVVVQVTCYLRKPTYLAIQPWVMSTILLFKSWARHNGIRNSDNVKCTAAPSSLPCMLTS